MNANGVATKKMPVGISTLAKIIDGNFIYIDKTRFVAELANGAGYYFLSRPRRFGKSLFLDTLKQAFLGNQALFKGLYLENNWDWGVQYPVIHISFAGEVHDVKLLQQNMHEILDDIIMDYGLTEILAEELLSRKFALLIKTLALKFKQPVVILVDEYDKPILDNIEHLEAANYARDLLKSLYSIIKDADQYLKFVFLTGVTKFAKAGVFSSLNNLNDITYHAQYADSCGYTQKNIETSFKDYLVGVDLQELKRWYNGYNFLGNEAQKVYNPYDILLFIDNGKIYKNYWFETGNPSFLIKLLQRKCYYLPNLAGIQITDNELGSFDIDNLTIEVLLLQAGYLTIKSAVMDSMMGIIVYTLDYPNFEVRQSLNGAVLAGFFNQNPQALNKRFQLYDALRANNFDQLRSIFSSFLAGIPHDLYRNKQIQHYEGFYSIVIYTLFSSMSVLAIAEDTTNLGQIDLTVHLADKILIIEFKMLRGVSQENTQAVSATRAVTALQQIKDKKYHEKYLDQNKAIYLIGMVFDEASRNICEYEWELMAKV